MKLANEICKIAALQKAVQTKTNVMEWRGGTAKNKIKLPMCAYLAYEQATQTERCIFRNTEAD